jgi:hypothetical protein
VKDVDFSGCNTAREARTSGSSRLIAFSQRVVDVVVLDTEMVAGRVAMISSPNFTNLTETEPMKTLYHTRSSTILIHG